MEHGSSCGIITTIGKAGAPAAPRSDRAASVRLHTSMQLFTYNVDGILTRSLQSAFLCHTRTQPARGPRSHDAQAPERSRIDGSALCIAGSTCDAFKCVFSMMKQPCQLADAGRDCPRGLRLLELPEDALVRVLLWARGSLRALSCSCRQLNYLVSHRPLHLAPSAAPRKGPIHPATATAPRRCVSLHCCWGPGMNWGRTDSSSHNHGTGCQQHKP
jgi:hypothetical protein